MTYHAVYYGVFLLHDFQVPVLYAFEGDICLSVRGKHIAVCTVSGPEEKFN